MFQRAARALRAPFANAGRLERLSGMIEKRLDRLERRGLKPLAERQEQIETQLDQLSKAVMTLRHATGARLASKDERSAFRRALPAEVDSRPTEGNAVDVAGMGCPPGPILVLGACPVCGSEQSTAVCRFNKMITMRQMPDEASSQYRYSLCHGCGVVYASRRPEGERFAWLLQHFEESLGRTDLGSKRAGKIVLNSYDLDEEGKIRLRELASKGVFVSEHDGSARKDYLWQLQADRLSNSRHLEVLGSLLDLRRPRVLEIRSRLGSILAGLQRIWKADTYAIPMFPSQRFLIQEVYGIPADAMLDFDHFRVPYGGTFDLILSNHMITHAVRPKEYLATVHAALRPGGHVYFYNEPLEEEFLDHDKSMFNTLNAFHLQAFNRDSFARALNANGFEVVYMSSQNSSLFCLARRSETPVSWSPMSDHERSCRRRAYRAAEELSILLVPEEVRYRFVDRWKGAVERGLETGFVAADERGRLRLMIRTAALRENAMG